jgi:hypothetical protein
MANQYSPICAVIIARHFYQGDLLDDTASRTPHGVGARALFGAASYARLRPAPAGGNEVGVRCSGGLQTYLSDPPVQAARSARYIPPMQAELDLLIRAALLANLPRSGSVWPEQERQEWLQLAEAIFEMVYRDGVRPYLREINPADMAR